MNVICCAVSIDTYKYDLDMCGNAIDNERGGGVVEEKERGGGREGGRKRASLHEWNCCIVELKFYS